MPGFSEGIGETIASAPARRYSSAENDSYLHKASKQALNLLQCGATSKTSGPSWSEPTPQKHLSTRTTSRRHCIRSQRTDRAPTGFPRLARKKPIGNGSRRHRLEYSERPL